MADLPTIHPTSFDLIVLGTGLPQCIVAAAAASVGRSVLHLDCCDFYGSHWASLPLTEFSDWAASAGVLASPFTSSSQPVRAADGARDVTGVGRRLNGFHDDLVANGSCVAVNDQLRVDAEHDSDGVLENGVASSNAQEATRNRANEIRERSLRLEAELAELGMEAVGIVSDRSWYSNFKICENGVESLGPSRNYSIDLASPKLLFCGGPLVDLLLKSEASKYLEFKGLEGSYVWTAHGLTPVPSSRADVFKDRSLSPVEKRYLMRFFKLVMDYATGNATTLGEEDLNMPFAEFLKHQQLPSSIHAIILYAIALADYDQEQHSYASSTTMNARDGLQGLALYLSSVGRFSNANGAFLYPLYGQGELPQALSRRAAVNGALHVLRMPVSSLLIDKERQAFRGVRTALGQSLFSQKLVTSPLLFSVPRTLNSSTADISECSSRMSTDHDQSTWKVACGVCVTDGSLWPGQSTILVVFPPRSLDAQITSVIRALQFGSNALVCPEGKFVVQLSTTCSEEFIGVESLQRAAQSLFYYQDSVVVSNDVPSNAQLGVVKPSLLWSVFYVQHGIAFHDELWVQPDQVAVCGMPDGTLDYRTAVRSAEKAFHDLFPEEQFFPRIHTSDHSEDS